MPPAPDLASLSRADWLGELRPRHLWIAYSGGLDSTVLLHWLAMQQDQLPGALAALHVDHGLHPHSARWAEHCRRYAETLAIPCQVKQARVVIPPGVSPEAAARNARYGLLSQVLGTGDVLLTAHHRDDQVETLLLQLFRGAGPAGLGAMPQRLQLGLGYLLRPLLPCSQASLRRYAEVHSLSWIDDPSNADTRIPRNWLRHQGLPALRARWPGLDVAVARSAKLCAAAASRLDAEAGDDLQGVMTPRGSVSLEALAALSTDRQQHCLRRWLREQQLPLPTQRQLTVLLQTMHNAAADRQPCVCWPGAELRRFRGELYAMAPLPKAPEGSWSLTPGEPLELPGVGRLGLKAALGQGLAAAHISTGVQVVFRRGGERFRSLGSAHHCSLKHWYQQQGLAPWERERLPLLQRHDGALLAVGEWINTGFEAQVGEPGWVIAWQKAALFVNV